MAKDNLELGIVDSVVPEPVGGAHRDPAGAVEMLKIWITRNLGEIANTPTDELLDGRYARFRRLGRCEEVVEPDVGGGELAEGGEGEESASESRDELP